MLLGNVLFLTGLWHDSVLTAGLSLSPGPLMAAALSVPAGRLAAGVGRHRLAAAGGLLFALSGVWWIWRMGTTPDYAGALLPSMVLGGAGVGLTIPSLSSAAVSELPPARFATGSAVFAMARQVGSVLGVAILIAILGHPGPADALAAFRDGWIFISVATLAASAVAYAARAPGASSESRRDEAPLLADLESAA
jgi:MFS family permease